MKVKHTLLTRLQEQTNLDPCYPLDEALNLEDVPGRTYFIVEYV
jgi:hypothetical protein